jgi:hypothetical protein
MLGFAALYAQAPREADLAKVTAGLLHTLERAEDSDDESGHSFDSSLSWTKNLVVREIPRANNPRHKNFTKETESISFSFNGYSFYLLWQNQDGRYQTDSQTITLDGNIALAFDTYSLNGQLSVRGADSVRSIAFNNFAIDEAGGTVLVNGQSYDADLLRNALEEAYDTEVFDADKEGAVVFLTLFTALFTTDISSVLDSLGEEAQHEVPPGLTASNPEKTLTITSQKNRFNMKFDNFAFGNNEFYDFPFNTLINGTVAMILNLSESNFDSIVYDGSVDVQNMRFITLAKFESCTLSDNKQDYDGNIVINGKSIPFSQFMPVFIRLGTAWF